LFCASAKQYVKAEGLFRRALEMLETVKMIFGNLFIWIRVIHITRFYAYNYMDKC